VKTLKSDLEMLAGMMWWVFEFGDQAAWDRLCDFVLARPKTHDLLDDLGERYGDKG